MFIIIIIATIIAITFWIIIVVITESLSHSFRCHTSKNHA